MYKNIAREAHGNKERRATMMKKNASIKNWNQAKTMKESRAWRVFFFGEDERSA